MARATPIILSVAFAAAILLGTAFAEGQAVLQNLRCEYRTNPLGIDETAPCLSWEMSDPRRGAAQSAYQVLVAGTEADLDADRGDLWDSGRVASDESAHVVYAGKPLTSRTACWWKVRVWDEQGNLSPWSDTAKWSMGLLEPSDWKAAWIGCDGAGPCPHLRKVLRVAGAPRRAVVYATALGLYELRINGHRVGRDRFTPGWTDYRRRVCYQAYDVTDLLVEGENAVGAVLAPGWYAGHVGLRGPGVYGRVPWLLAQLEIECADGSVLMIATDGTWRAAEGPTVTSDLLMGETYDARRRMPGWDTPGFGDAAWQPVDLKGRVQADLCAYPGAPVRTHEEVHPVKVAEPKPGAWVFDMGQEFAGWVRLKVQGNAGDKVVLRFAEMLQPDGTIYTANLRGAKCTDTYVLGGDGEEVWEPRFTYRAFRYVEVTGYPGRPGPDSLVGVTANAATPPAGKFECSSESLNRLHRNIVWTQRANFLEVPTDCPQRDERLGWTGDAQIFVRTAAFNADVAAFFTKWLVDLDDAQTSDGAFTDVAPRVAAGAGTAAWGDAGVVCPWILYRVYGDRRLLERHYPAMTKWIAYLQAHSERLLRPAKGYGDWLSIGADTPKDVLATAYFAHSTSLVACAARVLGREADAARFEQLFADVRDAFNCAYVAADGRIKGDTQTVYVLALAFDLLPEDKRAAAMERLVADIDKRGGHLSTGFVGTGLVMPLLADVGRTDVAYRLLTADTFPSWLFSVRQGATTVWERWDGWTPEKGFQDPGMNSFAHYAFGAVGEWLYTTVAGIDTDGPGFKHIVIRPRPGGGLEWAKAGHHSIRGFIASSWRRDGTVFDLEVCIPANAAATVHVPAADAASVTEGDQPAARAEGVTFVGTEDGAAIFKVGAGTYRFRSVSVAKP